MARRKDLLSEAIADAKAVKETALANAKLALEEAFTPKLQSMISAKLAEEADEEVDEMEEELDSSDLGAGDNAQPDAGASDSSDIENDDELIGEEEVDEEEEVSEEEDMEETYGEGEEMDEDDDMDSEEELDMDDDMEDDDEDDLDLESVIAELEAEMAEEEGPADENYHEEEEVSEEEDLDEEDLDEEEIDLDEVIRTLKEMEEGDYNEEEDLDEEEVDEEEDLHSELEEAYSTIASLKNTINEVNLLNAKLLYTNKLFRTFDLNENQKVKVLENFDRTSSVREVKLVFSTLAENLNVAKKKRSVVKEGYASKATKSSAPKKEIISEGNELSARWKKLAGLK